MRIAITGASGLIGSALTAQLRAADHTVLRLVRRASSAEDEISWRPKQGTIDTDRLHGCDAIVHLAGKSLFGRWTQRCMQEIRTSRVNGTELLARTLVDMADGPRIMVCSSAVGYYGSGTGDEILTEDSPSGKGFLANVVREWEAATQPARDAGLRVVNIRTGLVLTDHGSLLGPLLPIFRIGLGGRLGSGQQWMSWIHLSDIVGIIHYALTHETLTGPINAVAPNPVRNQEFTHTLAAVLHRPALIPVPLFGVSLVLGKTAAQELAGASQRVSAQKILEAGYPFQHTTVDSALREIVKSRV